MNGYYSNYSHQDFDLDPSIVMQQQVSGGYMDPEQTFHTPSFGDEEFDIPPLSLPTTGTLATEGTSGNITYHSQNTDPSQTLQLSATQQQHMISITMPSSGKQMDEGDYQQQQQTLYMNAESLDDLNLGATSYNVPVTSCPTVYLTNDGRQQMGMSTAGTTSLLSTISHTQLSSQLRMQFGMRNQATGSPPCSNQTSPGLETSEDSDDSATVGQAMGLAMKRPSPDLIPGIAVGKAAANKKVKVPKKKKKRDPNEPQKPVSAYALFFRDTQAAIKGQNPNASFGEVSKIVASMWDSLDEDHKNVYKKRTELAKKEYLKALAAYRASLVSKGCETSDSAYGISSPLSMQPSSLSYGSSSQMIMPSSYYNTPSSVIGATSQELSPLQKKSPLLTSLMENSASSMSVNPAEREVPQIHSMQMPHVLSSAPSHMQVASAPQQQQVVLAVGNTPFNTPVTGKPRQMSQMQFNLQPHFETPSHTYTTLMTPSNSGQTGVQDMVSGQHLQGMSMDQHGTCLRNGCPNPAIESPEWDSEYCSNDCVVSHCRDVFTTWVASRQTANSFPSVK